MAKYSMCRICLVDSIQLHLIVDTPMQKIYESLTSMPFVTEDRRSLMVCHICCAKLEVCYQLRRISLQSEKLFTQILTCNVQIRLPKIKPDVYLSGDDVAERIPTGCYDDDVKQEDSEVAEQDLFEDYHILPSDPEENSYDIVFKNEQSDIDMVEHDLFEDYKIQPLDSEDSSLAVVKKEQSEVVAITGQDPLEDGYSTIQRSADMEEDLGVLAVLKKQSDVAYVAGQDVLEDDHIHPSYPEEDSCGVVFKNEQSDIEIVEHELFEDDHIQPSGSEDSSLAVVKKEQSDAAVSPPVAKNPRLVPHMNHTGETSGKLQRGDENKVKIEQAKSETDLTVEDKPDQRSKIVEACVKVKRYIFTDKESNNNAGSQIDGQRNIVYDSSKILQSYLCETFWKKFRTKGYLVVYEYTPTGRKRKPHICDICKKCFSDKSKLKEHVRTHTGEKPYICDVCKKCFARKDVLYIHIRKHTGEKPYMCDVCKKCFITRGNLNKHIRTHTDEKPYMCEVCKKCFSEKSYLNAHIRRH